MTCTSTHRYTVEVVGRPTRYIGPDEDDAISALLTINPDYDEEGYIVAEHDSGGAAVYCPAESGRIENEAIKAAADMASKWQDAVDAFHGEGPYAVR